jgi:hypothetical protein
MTGKEISEYADGTYLEFRGPWHVYAGGRALCPDGRVRSLRRIALEADTFFSVPASVAYKGKTISGYVSVETRDGYDTATDEDPAVVKFHPYKYGKNGGIFDEAASA